LQLNQLLYIRDVKEDFGAVRRQGFLVYTTKSTEQSPPPKPQTLCPLISVHDFTICSETALIARLRSPGMGHRTVWYFTKIWWVYQSCL